MKNLLPCLLLDLVAVVGLFSSLWWGTSLGSLVANVVLVTALLCFTLAAAVRFRKMNQTNTDLSNGKGD